MITGLATGTRRARQPNGVSVLYPAAPHLPEATATTNPPDIVTAHYG